MTAPWRRDFDTARDPYAARNALGITSTGGGSSFQPLDADLTSLAAASATNAIYYRSAADTWGPVTIGANLTFTGGTLAATGGAVPTRQVFTSGSGTYTTPASVRWIEVELVGGGSGGQGWGNSLVGGNTTFGALTANGGPASTSTPTTGGTASGGDINIIGGAGTAFSASDGTVFGTGGAGGGSFFGGGGAGGYAAVGRAAVAVGAGGGGGGTNAATVSAAGSGGNAGGYLRKLISSPSATYSYAVGAGSAGGAAGSTVNAAGAGAAGIIIVTEYY